MKKFLGVVIVFFIVFGLTYGISSSAGKIASIEFQAPETLKKGEKATVSVHIKNANRLYGIQWDYTFNTQEIKVLSMKKGEMLANAPYGSMDSSGNTIQEGRPVTYYLTFTGQNDGVSGDGEVIKMEVEALKDCKLSFTTKNSNIILVDISKDYEIGNPSYNFIGTEEEETIDPNKPAPDNSTDEKPNTNDGNNSNNTNNNSNNENADDSSNNTNSNSSDSNSSDDNDKPTSSNGESEDKNTNSSDSNTVGTSGTEESASSNTLPIVVGLAVIALGGIGGFIYYKRKK